MDRRLLLKSLTASAFTSVCAPFLNTEVSATPGSNPFIPPAGPRSRVLYLNDLAGDIDGLFATAHMILSTSIDLRGIVGTTGDIGGSELKAKENADTMLSLMGQTGKIKTFHGAESKLAQAGKPLPSPGAQAIIEEALRTDTMLPLIVAVGGGLTEVASALLMEPRIAGRFTLIWIGGGRPHPEWATLEPNFKIDPLAAQHIFNNTSTPIWQVPSEVYQSCMVSDAEISAYVRPAGAIGEWLYAKIIETSEMFMPSNAGATWCLGDNPLILLAALTDQVPSKLGDKYQSFQYNRTGSSQFDEVYAPIINNNGRAIPRSSGRKIRIYRSIDSRLLFGDFFAKMKNIS